MICRSILLLTVEMQPALRLEPVLCPSSVVKRVMTTDLVF